MTFQALGVSFPPPGTARWKLDLTEGVHRQRRRLERFDEFYSVYHIDLPTVAGLVAQNAKEVEKKSPTAQLEVRTEQEEEETGEDDEEDGVVYDPNKDSDEETEAKKDSKAEMNHKRVESKGEKKRSEQDLEENEDDEVVADVSDDEKEKTEEPKKKLVESKHSQLTLRMQKLVIRRGTRVAREIAEQQSERKVEEEEPADDDLDEDDDQIDDWDRVYRMLSPGALLWCWLLGCVVGCWLLVVVGCCWLLLVVGCCCVVSH